MGEPVTFSLPSPMSADCFRELNRFRMTGELCDAILSTEDGGAFRVHKMVMCMCSEYFRTLFTTSLLEKSSGEGSKRFYRIPGVSSSILEAIIMYAYSGIVDVNPSNINSLMPAADQFNVTGIVEQCTNYMLENMTTENCIGFWRFAMDYYIPRLKEKARRFILANFVDVSALSKEFLQLKLGNLKDFLTDDSLNTTYEHIVWVAIKRWCQYKCAERQPCIPDLLTCVRMALLSTENFQEIKNDPRVHMHAQCISYIKLVSKYFLNELKDVSEIGDDKTALSMFTPRHPYEIIIVSGGWMDNTGDNIFEAYDCRADIWKKIFFENLDHRFYHQIACVGKYIYVIGGCTTEKFLNTCWRLDFSDFSKKEISPMHEQRSYVSVAVLKGKIYAMGGFNGFERLRTVECYDDARNQWSYTSPMHERRSDASASALRDRIFIVGGYNGDTFLNSAECYYAKFDQWLLLPDMMNCRSGVGCVALESGVYAIGGYDGESRMDSVEKYSIKHRQWIATKCMETPRSNFAVTVLENRIYVMGGYNESSLFSMDQGECYDPIKNQWQRIAPLNIGRTGSSACTISGIQEIQKFIKPDSSRCLLK